MAAGAWAPFKELSYTVNLAIGMKQPNSYYALENMLKKHKPDMHSLLKNPSRDPNHRLRVQNATKDGLLLSNTSQPLHLPQDFIDESLILSDILDLNELSAVELLLAGEQHLPDFPTLSRGLVAVLLYYDGRRNLVTSLRSLIQARDGVSWSLNLSSNIVSLVTSYTDDLFGSGLFTKIMQLLKEINIEKELNNLMKGKAIKDNKHKQQIIDLIKETIQALGDCLFYWACQSPLPKDLLFSIVTELKQVPALNEGHHPLGFVHLSLFFTLLASFKAGDSPQDESESTLDNSFIEQRYPFLTDPNSLCEFHEEIVQDNSNWSNKGLEAAVQFVWAVFLRECTFSETLKDYEELEFDEALIDKSINSDAFQFLRQSIVHSTYFINEEHYMHLLHHIITMYIHLMPVKITELRNQGDEVAREEMMRLLRGAPPKPLMKQNFGEFMLLIGDLYINDKYNLSCDYWPVMDARQTQAEEHKRLSLYKFINQCSDLLPPSLFSSFMTMLIGLSSSPLTAQHCFELLKSNSPSQGGGGPSAVISFDHFFHSLRQYYIGLKQTGGPSHTPTGCAISPQELDGLLIVLKLLNIIVDMNEEARVMIYDNQTWLPVASLFGLVGCPVSRQLKTQIFRLLSSFAKTADIASNMWNTLEVTQILNTSPEGGATKQYGRKEGSIQTELLEMETADEEYSETRAFLDLLDSLTDNGVPLLLGIDHRIPGFQPYLEFVCNDVFLRFDTFSYKDPQEKWMMASSSLNILHKLLINYEISLEDLHDRQYEMLKGKVVTLPQQPGLQILLLMLQDSVFLRKVLYIIDECSLLMFDVESATIEVAGAALKGLKIIETVLSKQNEFLSLLRTQSSSLMPTPLDELLLKVNPRTKRADNFINVSKYVTFNNPELASVAVRILHLSTRSVVAGREIVNQLISDEEIYIDVLHGFVEHLEWEESYYEPHTSVHEEGGAYKTHRQLKEDILKLLVLCVTKSRYSVGHFLLGFIQPNENKKHSDIILQDPGILGSSKTCFHSILDLIKFNSNISQGCHRTHPQLAQLCYQLLYLLSSDNELSQPTLRYLRNNHDYFYQQLSNVPFPWLQGQGPQDYEEDETELRSNMLYLNQISWILRSVAVELKMTLVSNQRSHTERLVTSLLSSISSSAHMSIELTNQMSGSSWSDNFGMEGRRKILVLLDLVEFPVASLPPLELKYFDQQRTEEVIKSCETNEEGVVYVDVKLLHKLLMNELSGLQGAAALAQKPYIVEEIRYVLSYVTNRNQLLETLHCRQLLMESWQQVIEILMGVVSEEGKERQQVAVLFELIQDLLLKVEQCEPNPLTATAQCVIFTLMGHLRCCMQTISGSYIELDSTLAAGPLQSILRGLLTNIIKCPVGMQKLRSYLYTTLLSYLHMTRDRESDMNNSDKGGLWRLEYNTVSVAAANISILSGCGESLMDIICRDACSGHDVVKMLALSILDCTFSLDKQSVWLKFMISKGYLNTLCSTLQQDDQYLQKILYSLPESLRPLYVYESKMALLTRVASTSLGARELIVKNFISTLGECGFIDQRPSGYHDNVTAPPNISGFIPSVSMRYTSLFVPVLRFISSLLSTNIPLKNDVCLQVIDFIATHIDMFTAVLKGDHRSAISVATLRELSLVTSIITRCRAGHDWLLGGANHVHTANLLRIQHHVLSLVPIYCFPEQWKEIATRIATSEERGGNRTNYIRSVLWEEIYTVCQNICTSIVSYCQYAMSVGGSELSGQFCRIIFHPNISAAPKSSGSSNLSLSLIVASLKELRNNYFTELEIFQHLKLKQDNIKDMSLEELQQLLYDITSQQQNLSLVQYQQQTQSILNRLLSSKRHQLSSFIYIMEHMLYILWSHLQFYFNYQPNDQINELSMLGMTMRRLRGGSDSIAMETSLLNNQYDISGFTMTDIDQLKVNTVTLLNDKFFKELLDASDNYSTLSVSNVTVSFINALVRRIRKLIKVKAAARPVLQLK